MQSPLSSSWAAKSPKIREKRERQQKRKEVESRLIDCNTLTPDSCTQERATYYVLKKNTLLDWEYGPQTTGEQTMGYGNAVLKTLRPRHEIYFVLWIWLVCGCLKFVLLHAAKKIKWRHLALSRV